MTEPTFDKDGYPTEETLQTITKWPINDFRDTNTLMRFAQEAWHWPDWGITIAPRRHREHPTSPLVRKWSVSTGGWSGNESIINALQDNFVFWALTWVQTRRGGHYIFHIQEV